MQRCVCLSNVWNWTLSTGAFFFNTKLYLYQPTQLEHNEKTSVSGDREAWLKL